MANNIDGYIFISTHLDTEQAQREGRELGDDLDEHLHRELERINREMGGVGDSALTAGGMIKANLVSDFIISGVKQLGSALASAAKESLALAQGSEVAFAKVTTLLKGDDLQQYYDGLMEISNRKGVAFADLAEAAYSALSAGVAQENVLEFVENSIGLAKGGFTETATAIDIVTTALNAYHMEMSEATHVQDVLITTQNLGKTTVGELASNMGKLIPTANGVNIAFDQLGAMYATVTANGVATAESTTYLNSMINELGASGTTAEKAMMAATEGTELAGKKFSEIQKEGYDVTDVLALMDKYAQSTGKSLSDMFSSSEGAKAAAILLHNSEKFKENLDAMVNSIGAAETAAAIMGDTTAEKIENAKTQIDNMVSTLASALIPCLGDIAEDVSGVVSEIDVDGISNKISGLAGSALVFLRDSIKFIGSAISGVTTGIIAFKAAAIITKVIASWQNAALQVRLFAMSEGEAAIKTAALNGTLTRQEIVVALLSGKLDIATVKQLGLNTAMAANPAGIIAAAVGLLATAITGFALSAGDATDETEDLNASMDESLQKIQEYRREAAELSDIAREYDELSKSAEDTAEKREKLIDLQQQFIDKYGAEVEGIDLINGAYEEQAGILQDVIDKTNTLARNEIIAAYNTAQAKENEEKSTVYSTNYFKDKEGFEDETRKAIMAAFNNSYVQKALEGVFKKYDNVRAIGGSDINELYGLVIEGNTDEKLAVISDVLNALSGFDAENNKIGADISGMENVNVLFEALKDEQKRLSDQKTEIDTATANYNELMGVLPEAVEKGVEDGVGNSGIADNKVAQSTAMREAVWETDKPLTDEQMVDLFKKRHTDIDRLKGTGQMTDAEYLQQLIKITDTYLRENTDDWWDAQQEIYKFEQNLAKSSKGNSQTVDEAKERLNKYRDEKQLADDKYNAGELDASAYLEQLKALRKEYLDEGTHEWYAACEGISDFISEQEEKREDERVKAFEKERNDLQFLLKTNKISEKKYYDELAKLRDKYLDENSNEWRDAYLEIYEFNRQLAEQNKETLDEMFDGVRDGLKNVVSARDSLTSKLVDFNKNFEKVTETIPETVAVKGDFTVTTAEHDEEVYKMGADSVEDNIRVLEEYGAMLDALKSRGADNSVLNDILDMDVDEGLKAGNKLLSMSDKEWSDYFSSLEKLRQTAADISEKYYQSEVDTLRNSFIDKVREEFSAFGGDMFAMGMDAVSSFVAGWNEELGKQDLTVDDVLRSYSGGSIEQAPMAARTADAAGISAFSVPGYSSEQNRLNSSLNALAAALTSVPDTSKGTKTIVPIMVGIHELGEIIIEGINASQIKIGKTATNS